ncbi:MAG: sugar transferase, partial [Clostridia bacterium]|nr:sugar transferase [Clostridia bacterium]
MILRPWEKLPDYMRTEEVRPYYEILRKRPVSLILKRLFDIIVSLILLLLLSPFMAVIAAAVRLD